MAQQNRWWFSIFLVLGAVSLASWNSATSSYFNYSVLAQSTAVSTPLVTPSPPNDTDLEVTRFIFAKHQPELGSLAEGFLQKVKAGEYTDFTRQDVDLTGDHQPEILVTGRAETLYLFVAILNRNPAGKLREMFYTASTTGKYSGEVRVTIEGQRVIADFLTSTGGASYLETTWEQRWVECQTDKCTLVWSAPLMSASRSVNQTIERSYSVATVEQSDPNTIKLTTYRFGLSMPAVTAGGEPFNIARRIVGPNSRDIYRRNEPGRVYRLARRVEMTLGQEIAREFSLQTIETNKLIYDLINPSFSKEDGTFDSEGYNKMQAEIWDLPASGQPDDPTWGTGTRQADIAAHNGRPGKLGEWVAGIIGALNTSQCRLVIQRQVDEKLNLIGRTDLPCTINLTRLAWVDVTNDDTEELLLLTIPPDSDAAGQFQRLHVYTTSDNKLTELAQLDGVINGADGAGIRWEKTEEGSKVLVGLPLIDPDAFPTLADLRLEREFQPHVWDATSRTFQPEE